MGKMDESNRNPETDFRYGWLCFTPRCLQVVNRSVFLLIVMCFANIFQSMTINGLVGVILTSLETRFGFPSSKSSWIASSYDISTIPMLAILSYFGARSHRPRITSMGLFLLVLGTAIFIFPHFTTPVYQPGAGYEEDPGLCVASRNITDEGNGEDLQGYLAVFIFGRILHGIGAVPLYTIAVTFMDDTVSKDNFSIYIAFFYAAGVLGPALGYIVGGTTLTLFTDFDTVDSSKLGITSSSRGWVGAWWLGFLLGAIALALACIPMSGFPRDLPGAAEIRAAKVSEAYDEKKADEDDLGVGDAEINVSAKDLPRYFKDLFTNPTYVFLTLMVCCDSFLVGGYTAFGPKYVQEQFAVTAAASGMMFGIAVIPGGAGGTIAGGVIVKKLKLKCAGIMKGEMVFSITIMLAALMFFIICAPLKFIGVNTGYFDSVEPRKPNYTASCNVDCNCEILGFSPICSKDNYQYFSPCHAGCTDQVTDGSTTKYYNCSCVGLRQNATDWSQEFATSSHCSVEGCNYAPLFMVIFFFAMFCLFACSSMNITATIRCLPATHRSLGIGVQWIFLRVLGTVPGPLVFGALFDRACMEHYYNAKGEKQQCIFYDKTKMAMFLLAICLGIKLASLLFIILAWRLYKPPRPKKVYTEFMVEDSEAVGNRNIPMKGLDNTGFEPDFNTVPNGSIHPKIMYNGSQQNDSKLSTNL